MGQETRQKAARQSDSEQTARLARLNLEEKTKVSPIITHPSQFVLHKDIVPYTFSTFHTCLSILYKIRKERWVNMPQKFRSGLELWTLQSHGQHLIP